MNYASILRNKRGGQDEGQDLRLLPGGLSYKIKNKTNE